MNAMTHAELQDLLRLEKMIDSDLKAAFAVGRALGEVRDRALYRNTHTSFEVYCRQRFGIGKSRAYQLLISTKVSSVVPITNESQARALAGLAPEVQRRVFEAAAAKGKVTASALKDVFVQLVEQEETAAAAATQAAEATPRRPRLSTIQRLEIIRADLRHSLGKSDDFADLTEKLREALEIAEVRLGVLGRPTRARVMQSDAK
jgi:hypothetical protein